MMELTNLNDWLIFGLGGSTLSKIVGFLDLS